MPIALVTGAAVRVGRAIAATLAEAGYDLVIHTNRSDAALVVALATGLGRKAELVTADLATEQGMSHLIDRMSSLAPSLDLLVNSAARYEACPLANLTRASYQQAMKLNVEAPLFLSIGLLPLLQAAAHPSIVNITDAALDQPYAGYVPYMMSKAALAELTRAMARELAPHVRVNAVAPGTVAFPDNFDAQKRDRIRQRIPLGREGTAADIGRAVLYLARDAPYVTGHTLVVDGGARLT